MSETPSNAIFVIAAISVVIFSLVGVGVMTGVIPSSLSKPGDPQVAPNSTDAAASPTSANSKSEGLVQRKAAAGNSASLRAASEQVRAAPAQPGCANCGRVEMVSLVGASGFGTGPGTASPTKTAQRYAVLVRLEDGTARTFSYETQPVFRAGDTVRIVDGALTAD